MKNVRLFYKKSGRARFISHLDTMRFMSRLLRRAGLPVWYTEGFNPHLYITFAMPLSLGFESEYEIADIRLTDDSFPLDGICETLNANGTDGFYFFAAKEPVKKLSCLCFAKFMAEFDDGGTLAERLEKFLSSGSIPVEKKTKKGDIKTINAADDIKAFSVEKSDCTRLEITLPAGSSGSVNPELIIKKFLTETGENRYVKITRQSLLCDDLSVLC